MFCVVLLGVIPYQMAKRAHAVRRREGAGTARSRAGQAASGEPDAEGSPAPTLDIGIADLRARARRAGIPWDAAYETEGGARTPELQAMARDARIPWRAEYETAGGARAFLEILRVVSAGGTETFPQGEPAAQKGDERELRPTGESPQSREFRPPEPAGPTVSAKVQDTVARGDEADRAAHTDHAVHPAHAAHSAYADHGALADRGDRAGGAPDEDLSELRASQSSWSPSFSGSVYTSTDLYTSDRLEGTADQEDEPSTDDGDRTGGATPGATTSRSSPQRRRTPPRGEVG